MEKKRIYLSCPTMHGEEQQFIKEAFDTNWVAPLGPNVTAFEKELAEYVGIPYASALSAGTAAIHLALKILGVGQGDIVFSTDLTFAATCNPITYEKAIPVFIDSEEDTWNMDPEALKKAFEKYPNPKAVVIAHLYGTMAKMDEIMAICKERNVPVIEDAAEALGSTYKGQYAGTFGDIGIYSFNGNKIITTSGGGMLVSKSEEDTKKAVLLATQARDAAPHYQHTQIGYNYRMSNVVAGIGRGQLLHLDEHVALKKAIYEQYKEAFSDIDDITMNPLNDEGSANNWLSCMTLKKGSKVTPNQIMDALTAENIESRPIWKPMHLQPVYADCDFFTKDGLCIVEKDCSVGVGDIMNPDSVGADIFNRGLCLPSDIKNTEEDMNKIIGVIRSLFEA